MSTPLLKVEDLRIALKGEAATFNAVEEVAHITAPNLRNAPVPPV